MKNSKEKGNRYEREIAIKLSLWISEGKDKNILWRNTSSGARATISKDNLNNEMGDVSSISRIGFDFVSKFMVECKHYKNLNLENLIWRTTRSAQNIVSWWKKYTKEASKNNKLLMLLCKQNNKINQLLLVDKQFIDLFEISLNHVIVNFKDMNMYILSLDTFLKNYDFKKIYL